MSAVCSRKDDPKGLPVESVDKLRKMLAFLQAVASPEEVRDVPVWKAHRLSGDRKGAWSLHVTRNWRLTFRIDGDEIAEALHQVLDLDGPEVGFNRHGYPPETLC